MSAGQDRRWVCMVCGYIHEGPEPPESCPQCGADQEQFERDEPAPEAAPEEAPAAEEEKEPSRDDYLAEWAKASDPFEEKFARIKRLAATGESDLAPMRTQRQFPGWDDVLFRGAQLFRLPVNSDETVETRTVIGRKADKPLELAMPFYVSHMSFGALSKEAKVALARGSRMAETAICSGEGGMLPEERAEAGRYVYELGTADFSHREEAMRQADAVEIKIGQAVKPGMGGELPAEKVTEEIARVRGIPAGQASNSPGRYCALERPEDLNAEVERIRSILDGQPVGVKIAAGHVEEDLRVALDAGPDFITLDCRGGATGAAALYVKDNVCLPAVYALHRARRFLDQAESDVTLCVTGGFRDSADIAKALAMGADAVALATASLIAIGCQQYRICHTGNCPVGVTTHDETLRARLDVNESAERLARFYAATCREVANLARINGRRNVRDLDVTDLVTINHEISQYTSIEHA